MRYYLALDGGGTKLQGILFDEEGTILSTGLSGGVNGNVHSREDVEAHFRECMQQLFSIANKPAVIDAIYISQGVRNGLNILQEFAEIKEIIAAGEGTIGLLACGIQNGICSLSGTGCDTFYVKDAKERNVYGGWGYMMSDDGSGVWVGSQAARYWILKKRGIAKPTIMTDLFDQERPELALNGDMIEAVYRHHSPAYYLGTYCPLVNRAAKAGDEVAIDILKRGGLLLADGAIQLIESLDLPEDYPIGTTGSVFRFCKPLREAFEAQMHKKYPKRKIYRPRFEPVVGAMIYGLIQVGHTLDENMMQRLEETCRAYRITDEN